MKIVLAAMGGIRVCDEESIARGLTLPGFVHRSKVIESLPSLGLLYLAAVTPPGHELAYVDIDKPDGARPEFDGADLVAISTFTAQVPEAHELADQLRARGIQVAMGGLHVSVLPGEARAHADYVVGEGENVWPEVVRAVERGESGRTWDSAGFAPVDAAALPVPRYDLLVGRPCNRFTVQTSRGCPWRCDFCGSSVMLQRPYRKRPVEHVVRDIQSIIDLGLDPFIEFADDNTFVDKRWGKELCRALAPLGVRWFTETDISVADDDELLDLMAASGCRQVLIGLESPGAAELARVEMKANFKQRRAHDYAAAVRRIQARGVTVNGCFVLGLDEQTPAVFDRVLAFAEETGLYDVQATVMTPPPGTPLYNRLRRDGRLIDETAWRTCTLFDVNFHPARMSVDELRQGMYHLTERLYTDAAVKRRRRMFFAARAEGALQVP